MEPWAAPLAALACFALYYLLSRQRTPARKAPYGLLDSRGILWDGTSVGKFCSAVGQRTVYEVMAASCSKYGGCPCAGRRPLLQRHYEEHAGKTVEKLTYADEFEWMSYAEYGMAMTALSSGMVEFAQLKALDRVVIYAETQRDWMLSCMSAFQQSLTIVTVYATLGEEGLAHGLTQTKAKLIIADAKLLPKVASAIKTMSNEMQSCMHVIYITDGVQVPDPKADIVVKNSVDLLVKSGRVVSTIDDAIALGKSNPRAPVPPAPEDQAVIMYTSGTTGLPKGVVLTHDSILHSATGARDRISSYLDVADAAGKDVFLAYLPLAHIMEMVVEISMYQNGIAVGYGSPHTLTANSVKIKAGTCVGDAAALKPTIMVFAPAVLDKVFAALNAKISASSKFVQMLFKWGIGAGETNFEVTIL